MEITPLVWAFLAANVSTAYFFLIKYYANNHEIKYLYIVIALELLVIYLYYKSLESSESGIMYSIINGYSVILGTAIAIIFFKEKLTNIDIFGIFCVVIGILILGQKRASVKIN
jgi:multidrug transporter EmrE-like cation transporter